VNIYRTLIQTIVVRISIVIIIWNITVNIYFNHT